MALFGITLVIVGNFAFSNRDGVLTPHVESFNVEDIETNKLWTEHPVQTLSTFMPGSIFFLAAGPKNQGGVPFGGRLQLIFGPDSLDESRTPIDLRFSIPVEDLEALLAFVRTLSYRGLDTCPHDRSLTCQYAVGWNRDRTKDAGVQMVVVRVGTTSYLITDDSVIQVGKE